MTGYTVKSDSFEGPLDLLLTLIEKRKLHISDVSLAKVADDYISYVEQLGEFPISESANFILIASTLLLIKSKSLLPNLELTSEEEESVGDLENRLKQYQKIKELSRNIKEMFGSTMLFFGQPQERPAVFSPTEEIKTEALLNSIRNVLQTIPKPEKTPQVVVKKVISLEEMIDRLTQRIQKSLKLSFKEFSGASGKTEKVHVIVSFLAMLELVKQGIVAVSQERRFDDIVIETSSVNTPRY